MSHVIDPKLAHNCSHFTVIGELGELHRLQKSKPLFNIKPEQMDK